MYPSMVLSSKTGMCHPAIFQETHYLKEFMTDYIDNSASTKSNEIRFHRHMWKSYLFCVLSYAHILLYLCKSYWAHCFSLCGGLPINIAKHLICLLWTYCNAIPLKCSICTAINTYCIMSVPITLTNSHFYWCDSNIKHILLLNKLPWYSASENNIYSLNYFSASHIQKCLSGEVAFYAFHEVPYDLYLCSIYVISLYIPCVVNVSSQVWPCWEVMKF